MSPNAHSHSIHPKNRISIINITKNYKNDKKVIFTTFSPSSGTNNIATCGADTGTSRVYALDLETAVPVVKKTLSHSGIAPRPVVVVPPGGKPTVQVGTESVDPNGGSGGGGGDEPPKCDTENCKAQAKYWRQEIE